MMTVIKFLVGIFLFVVCALAIVLFVVPPSTFKPLIQSTLSEGLNRDVVIDGELAWQFWPPLSLEANGLRIANLAGLEPADMVRADKVDLAIDAMAYLNGTAKLDHLRLVSPEISLHRLPDGQANWEFGGGAGESDDSGEVQGSSSSTGKLPKLSLGEILISDGSFLFVDEAAEVSHQADDINVNLGQDGQALVIDGNAFYNDENVSLTGQIDDFNGALSGASTPLQLSLDTSQLKASLAGTVGTAQADDIQLDLAVNDIESLLAWLKIPAAIPAEVPQSIDLKASLNASPSLISINHFELDAKPWQIDGSAQLELSERPKIAATIDLGAIDVSPWTNAPATESTTASPEPQTAEGWPDEVIELPLPLPLDIDLSVAFASINAEPLQLGAGSVGVYADNLMARIEVPDLALYGGNASVDVSIDSFEDTPAMVIRGSLAQVDAGPVLQALADFDRLEGQLNFQTELETSGRSVKSLVEGLQGNGDLLFRDGAILGINIASTMRQISSLGLSQEAAGERRTDFAELGGTYAIASGVVSNEDLQLRAPVLRLAGAGTIDLPAQTLDYAVTPKLSATLEGQDADSEPAIGAGIPIVVSGPWSDPQFQLAIGGTLSGDLRDPEALAQLVTQLGSNPEELMQLREQFGAGEEGGALQVLDAIVGSGDGDAAAAPKEQLEEAVDEAKEEIKSLKEGLGSLLNR